MGEAADFADIPVDPFAVFPVGLDAPGVIGDPARGMFARRDPLARLADRTRLVFTSVERVGADLRIVARVVREED